MQLVFVTSEAEPFAKTGGLGDVAGSLPKALAKLGHDVWLILPYYHQKPLPEHWPVRSRQLLQAPIGDRKLPATAIELAPHPNLHVVLIDQPVFFAREGIYVDRSGRDFSDNAERFCFLCRAALQLVEQFRLEPDCYHVHDWPTALIPALLMDAAEYPRSSGAGTVLTIHNIAFQGSFSRDKQAILGLTEDQVQRAELLKGPELCWLQSAVALADAVTTVSRQYAEEIKTEALGAGLDGRLIARGDALTGIVNGIDVEAWDPAHDPALPVHFAAATAAQHKPTCKRELQTELGLPPEPAALLLGMVSRLTEQKGLDLVVGAADAILAQGAQLVVLGSGDEKHHQQLQGIARRHPRQVALRIGFDETLARRIYAGADAFLMPSRFEPCGLSQLYSLRYGTVPIVRSVGGLVDTVVDACPANLEAGRATGIRFDHYTATALLAAVERCQKLYQQPNRWQDLIRVGMNTDWSWQHSASAYVDVYQRARQGRRQR